MAMSTADSYINSSSVLFANDLCALYGSAKNKELFLSKLFAAIFGILGVMLAILGNDLLDIVLTTNAFYMPSCNRSVNNVNIRL